MPSKTGKQGGGSQKAGSRSSECDQLHLAREAALAAENDSNARMSKHKATEASTKQTASQINAKMPAGKVRLARMKQTLQAQASQAKRESRKRAKEIKTANTVSSADRPARKRVGFQ